jgi:transposase
MENKKRFYSKEFKEKAVQLSYQRENLKELAGELGINVERLYKWRRASKSTSISPARGKVLKEKVFNEDSPEVKHLKKELQEARLELEILKKAVHIFSRSGGNITSL